jgi:3-oxoadipate enol-lactonase
LNFDEVAHQLPTVNIDGLRVSYRDAGLGIPIVLLPGLTGSKEWFESQYSGLSNRYRVLSYDLRQAGRQQYNVELLSEDLAKFLGALRIPSAVVGGHSFGGLIAQQFALSYPQRARSLLLISSFPHLDISGTNVLELLSLGDVQIKSAAGSLLSRLLPWRRKEITEPEGMSFLAAHTGGITRATLNERLRIIREVDFREQLPELTMPALIIAGAKDRPQMLEAAQVLYEGIQDSTLEVIEGAGHFCFYERHDLFNDIVDSFLTDRMASLG